MDLRLNDALECSKTPGDLVSIKCGHGGTTLSFSLFASLYVFVYACLRVRLYTRKPQTNGTAQHVALAENPLWAWV